MSDSLKWLYLQEEDVIKAGALDLEACMQTIEEMFLLIGRGDYILGGPKRNDHGLMLWFNESEEFPNMPNAGPDRRFMSLISYLGGDFDVMGNKWYGSNIANTKKGLPRSIHTFTLNDKETGAPLSMMAGNLISSTRTGAVPGVFSKYLAVSDARVLGAVGGGAINQSCVEAIVTAVSSLEKVVLYDINMDKGEEIARSMRDKLNIQVDAVDNIDDCVSQSDILSVAAAGKVKPKINEESVKPGQLILLTGAADMTPEMYSQYRIVADLWSMHEKWLEDGLERPEGVESIKSWAMSGDILEMVHNGEVDKESIDDFGDIINAHVTGRRADDEVIIGIMGGLPTADVAWGYRVYQHALDQDIGIKLPLWDSSYLV